MRRQRRSASAEPIACRVSVRDYVVMVVAAILALILNACAGPVASRGGPHAPPAQGLAWDLVMPVGPEASSDSTWADRYARAWAVRGAGSAGPMDLWPGPVLDDLRRPVRVHVTRGTDSFLFFRPDPWRTRMY